MPADARSILDVGCSTGVLGAALKARAGARIVGIEMDPAMASIARTQLDEVIEGDAASLLLDGAVPGGAFDAIVFADVLEHLVDPWSVLRASVACLTPGGVVVTSIPNVRHLDTILHLVVRGVWPYRDRGIHDRTHLRFFTKRNVRELIDGAGLTIDRLETNYRLIERPHRINRAARLLAWPGLRNFLAFQYLVRARKPL